MNIIVSLLLTGLLWLIGRPSLVGAGGSDKLDPLLKSGSASEHIENDDGSFSIEIVFSEDCSTRVESAFSEAAHSLVSLIHAPPETTDEGNSLHISVGVVAAESLNATAFTQVAEWNDAGLIPTSSVIMYDVDQVDSAEEDRIYDLALHELLHAFGFGLAWDNNGLLERDDQLTTFYIGLGGQDSIALSDDGLHWEESEYGAEIGTPFINENAFLGDITLSSLEDLGYEIDYGNSTGDDDIESEFF